MAQKLGISIVHQELNLFPNMTIAENIFSGNMPSKGLFGIEDRKIAKDVAKKYLTKDNRVVAMLNTSGS